MLKKLITLLTLIIMYISSTCLAFEKPDPNRWLWLGSDDKIGIWLDMQTFKVEKIRKSISHDGHNSANVWIQFYKTNEDQYGMQNFICDFDCNSIGIASLVVYNSKNEIIDSFNPMFTEFQPVVSGSIGECIYIMTKEFTKKKENNQISEATWLSLPIIEKWGFKKVVDDTVTDEYGNQEDIFHWEANMDICLKFWSEIEDGWEVKA